MSIQRTIRFRPAPVQAVSIASKLAAAEGARPADGSLLPKVATLHLRGGGLEAPRLFIRAAGTRSSGGSADGGIDLIDLVATHHVLCFENGEGLRPIGGYRAVTLAECEGVELEFPPLAAAMEAGSTAHAEALQHVLSEARRGGGEVGYSSDFVVAPEHRRMKVSAVVHELVAGLVYSDFRDGGLTCGLGYATGSTLKFFERVGYRRMEWQGQPLPPMPAAGGPEGGEEIVLLELPGPSDYARECYERHRAAIDGRLRIA